MVYWPLPSKKEKITTQSLKFLTSSPSPQTSYSPYFDLKQARCKANVQNSYPT